MIRYFSLTQKVFSCILRRGGVLVRHYIYFYHQLLYTTVHYLTFFANLMTIFCSTIINY